MSKYKIWLNPSDYMIIWPEDQEQHISFHRDITVLKRELGALQSQKIDQGHQDDVRRREEAFDLEDKRRLDGRQSPVQILQRVSDPDRTTPKDPVLQVIPGHSF